MHVTEYQPIQVMDENQLEDIAFNGGQMPKLRSQAQCDKCSAQERCDIPCKAYLQWYNARMEITRKKVGL